MKKKILVLLIVAIILPAMASSQKKIKLFQAIKNKMVKAKINGNGNGHYGKCVDVSLENLTSQTLNIDVETGQKFICAGDTAQDLMVTQAAAVALGPWKKESEPVYAMCIKKHRNAPKLNTSYNIGGLAEGYLLELAIIIEKHSIQDMGGQAAVWVLTDSASMENVSGTSKENILLLTTFLKNAIYEATHMPDPLMTEYYISGVLAFELNAESTGSVFAYDKTGKQISVLCKNMPFKEGANKYDFRLVNPAIKKDNQYFVRLIIGEKIVKEISLMAQLN